MTVPALIARPTRSWLWVGAHAASGSAVARVDGTRAGQISTVANGHPTNGTNSRNGHDHRWGVQGVPANGHPANGHHIVAQGRVLVASGEPPGADPGPDYEVLKVTEITGRTAGLPTYPSRRLP